MASRQEEKEARRRERMAQEEAERRAAARNRRIQMVLGGVLALLVIGGVAFALTSGGDGEGHDDVEFAGDAKAPSENTGVTLPAQETTDVEQAAKDAGCELVHAKSEGSDHAEREYTAADYQTNPPNSGPHTPEASAEGVYTDGPPELGPSVHALEHGRVNVQYKPGTPEQVVKQLETFVAETGGYHTLMFENQTNMDAQVAATAWTQVLTCPEVNDKTWDALRTFRERYLDKGPETVP